jgi:hypothetical protein
MPEFGAYPLAFGADPLAAPQVSAASCLPLVW